MVWESQVTNQTSLDLWERSSSINYNWLQKKGGSQRRQKKHHPGNGMAHTCSWNAPWPCLGWWISTNVFTSTYICGCIYTWVSCSHLVKNKKVKCSSSRSKQSKQWSWIANPSTEDGPLYWQFSTQGAVCKRPMTLSSAPSKGFWTGCTKKC